MTQSTMNQASEANSTNSAPETVRVYTDPKAAPKPALFERTITAYFRAPSRSATIIIPATAWEKMRASVTDTSYGTLLDAVLETAAKSILSARVGSMSIFPSEIDAALFTADAILSAAIGGSSDWLSKDELVKLWEESATRGKFITSPHYATSKAYRTSVAGFAELVTKLAGKTSQYTPAQLDVLLAKMEPSDLETELGNFIVRRVEQLRNKPAPALEDFGLL